MSDFFGNIGADISRCGTYMYANVFENRLPLLIWMERRLPDRK